jgi:hypothetical protein
MPPARPSPHAPTATAGGVTRAAPRLRLVLADDHPAMRDVLRDVLAPTYDIVAAVGDGEALVVAALDLEPT